MYFLVVIEVPRTRRNPLNRFAGPKGSCSSSREAPALCVCGGRAKVSKFRNLPFWSGDEGGVGRIEVREGSGRLASGRVF